MGKGGKKGSSIMGKGDRSEVRELGYGIMGGRVNRKAHAHL